MPWYLRLIWFGYSLLFAWSSSGSLTSLLSAQGLLSGYYHTLMAIAPQAAFSYCCAICAAIMNIISLWPLLCHTLGIRSSGQDALKTLLLLRIFLEIPAHNFEWQEIKALLHTNPPSAIAVILFSLLFLLPSYSSFLQQALGNYKTGRMNQ